MSEITLKWGTLKGWDFTECPEAMKLLEEYDALGSSMSAMTQKDTPEQKQLICKMIDAIDGLIYDDWNGGTMTKEAAKSYVLSYGQAA